MSDPVKTALGAQGLSPVRRKNLRSFSLTAYPFRGIVGVVLFLLVALGCNSSSPTTGRPLCVAGSTSVQPFAEKLAEVYMHRHPQARVDVQ
jgi:ABC-type phosphate transport system substrate-binding protein